MNLRKFEQSSLKVVKKLGVKGAAFNSIDDPILHYEKKSSNSGDSLFFKGVKYTDISKEFAKELKQDWSLELFTTALVNNIAVLSASQGVEIDSNIIKPRGVELDVENNMVGVLSDFIEGHKDLSSEIVRMHIMQDYELILDSMKTLNNFLNMLISNRLTIPDAGEHNAMINTKLTR